MRFLIIFFLSFFLTITNDINAQSAKSVYQWLNVPCSDLINCDTGCSACNLSNNSDQYFQGVSSEWIGISYCPHPVSSGDNAVGTYGWDMYPNETKSVLISFTTTVPVNVDSIIFKSAKSSFGPNMCILSISVNGSPFQTSFDDPISHYFENSFISNIGIVGSGTFKIKIQPYGSDEGMWFLDEVKVVVTPDISTGILAVPSMYDSDIYDQINYPYLDLLGRETNNRPSGIYIKHKKKNQ